MMKTVEREEARKAQQAEFAASGERGDRGGDRGDRGGDRGDRGGERQERGDRDR